jgi:hypothetical protein
MPVYHHILSSIPEVIAFQVPLSQFLKSRPLPHPFNALLALVFKAYNCSLWILQHEPEEHG